MSKVIIIAAVDRKGAIGYQNKLLFYLPADLKHFKELTTGHTIIMGRHTYESLPKGALPNRRNIVLSTQEGLAYPNVEIFRSLDEAMAHSSDSEQLFIIGGASVYRQSIDKADELCLTEIDATAKQADTFFPNIDKAIWQETDRESHNADEKQPYAYDFVTYKRKS